MTLADVKPSRTCKIVALGRKKSVLRKRLIDMGLTIDTIVLVRKLAPLGDPIEISLRGYELSLRREEAKEIEVELLK